MRHLSHQSTGARRAVSYAAGVALVAGVLTAPMAPMHASVLQGDSDAGTTKVSKRMSVFLSGKAQLSHGLRVRGARLSVETLRGEPITTYENSQGKKVPFPKGMTTSAGGGIFLPTRGLPRRFVVVVKGKSAKKKNGYGTYRAFVDRKEPPTVKVSFGTTAAVATYRLAKGKWSVAKASKRTVAAMRLPSYTRLGFDDRVNPVFVSKKILLDKSGGDIDKIVKRTARAARKGMKGPKLYKGGGPRAVTGPVGLLPWFGPFRTERPKAASGQLTGVVGTVLDVFDQASTLYSDISAGSTANQLNTITNQISGVDDQMDALSQQVSNLFTAQANATGDLVSWVANSTYSQMSSGFTATYSIESVWSTFEDMQTTPCPDYNNCSASNVNPAALASYQNSLERWGPIVPLKASPPQQTAAYLAANAEDITDLVLDNAGANGLMTWAWQNQIAATNQGNNSATSAPGVIPGGGAIPLTNGLTAPVSDQALSQVQYWLSQMQQAGIMGANYVQVCPQGCPNGYPNPLPTPNPSPNPTLGNLTGWPQQVEMLFYNAYAAAQNLPIEVPDGMVLDEGDSMLWANLGQVWINSKPGGELSTFTGASFQWPSVAGGSPTVTFDSSFIETAPGATITPGQAQALTWQMPTAQFNPQNPQTYTSCFIGDAGCAANWTSPQLGNSLGNNQASGLLYLTSYGNSAASDYNAQWDYLGALPTGNGALQQGISESPSQFWGQAPPLWVYGPQSGFSYTVAQGNSLGTINGINGQSTNWEYQVPTWPTGTPNLLLFSPVSNAKCYSWTSLAPVPPSNLPQEWVVPTALPGAKCPAVGEPLITQ